MNRPNADEYDEVLSIEDYVEDLEKYCEELEKENQKYKKYYNDFIHGDCNLCKWDRQCDIVGRVKKEDGTIEECDFGSLWELDDE